jgi:hypothetical protein
MIRAAVLAAVMAGALASPSPALAQQRDQRAGQALAAEPARADAGLEIGVGLRWIGAARFPAVEANESTSFGNAPFALFSADTSFDASAGVEARLGYAVIRALMVEGSFAFNPTRLTTKVSDDREALSTATATSAVRQFAIEGGVVVRPPGLALAKAAPFAAAGAGYLRHLHEGGTLVQSGLSLYVGGGVEYSVRPGLDRDGARQTMMGIRVDVRGVLLRDGALLDDHAHLVPGVGVSVFVR